MPYTQTYPDPIIDCVSATQPANLRDYPLANHTLHLTLILRQPATEPYIHSQCSEAHVIFSPTSSYYILKIINILSW